MITDLFHPVYFTLRRIVIDFQNEGTRLLRSPAHCNSITAQSSSYSMKFDGAIDPLTFSPTTFFSYASWEPLIVIAEKTTIKCTIYDRYASLFI